MLLQQTYYSAEMDPGTPTAFKMKLFARIANNKNIFIYHRKVLYRSVHDN